MEFSFKSTFCHLLKFLPKKLNISINKTKTCFSIDLKYSNKNFITNFYTSCKQLRYTAARTFYEHQQK